MKSGRLCSKIHTSPLYWIITWRELHERRKSTPHLLLNFFKEGPYTKAKVLWKKYQYLKPKGGFFFFPQSVVKVRSSRVFLAVCFRLLQNAMFGVMFPRWMTFCSLCWFISAPYKIRIYKLPFQSVSAWNSSWRFKNKLCQECVFLHTCVSSVSHFFHL